MTSPTSPRRAVVVALDNKAFNARIDDHVDTLKKLFALTYDVGFNAGKGRGTADYPGFGKIGKREVKSLQSQFNKELRTLKALYKARGQRRKAGKGSRVNNGFRIPMQVTPAVVQFFTGAADLAPLVNQLSFPRSNITTSALLTPLFAIYAKRHNLTSLARDNQGKTPDKMNRQFLGADAAMTQAFGPSFATIQQQDMAKIAAAGGQNGGLKPGKLPNKQGQYKSTDYYRAFDPQNFTYAKIQSIVAANRVPKTQQTVAIAEMSKPVKDRYQDLVVEAMKRGGTIDYQNIANQIAPADQALQLRARLDTEQQAVSLVLAGMRQQEKLAEKAAKAARR